MMSRRKSVYFCSICGKVNTRKREHESHTRMHTLEKPFKCPGCKYASGVESNLRRHAKKCQKLRTQEKNSMESCLHPYNGPPKFTRPSSMSPSGPEPQPTFDRNRCPSPTSSVPPTPTRPDPRPPAN